MMILCLNQNQKNLLKNQLLNNLNNKYKLNNNLNQKYNSSLKKKIKLIRFNKIM